MNLFKIKRITISTSFYSGIYMLRASEGTCLSSNGRAAVTKILGDKKTISKAFHKLLKDLDLPKDRLNWKRIDKSRMTWELS